jgi:hypothetical protein
MAEKLRVSEFHMLEIDITYSEEEVNQMAAEEGLTRESAGGVKEYTTKAIELVLYEERKILVAAAIRSGLLDLETGRAILLAWKPKGV